jgi:hypothetical protein
MFMLKHKYRDACNEYMLTHDSYSTKTSNVLGTKAQAVTP